MRSPSLGDSGLFHVFSDADRRRYVEGLATVLKPGGRLFILCFSDKEPETQGPRRMSKEELARRLRRGLGRRVHRAVSVRGSARSEGHHVQRGWAEGVVCCGAMVERLTTKEAILPTQKD